LELINQNDSILSIPYPISLDANTQVDLLFCTVRQLVEDQVDGWFQEAQAILDSIRGEENDIARAFRTRAHSEIPDRGFKTGIIRKVNSGKAYLINVLRAEKTREELKSFSRIDGSDDKTTGFFERPRKVFISHKSEDANYAEALISLINFIIGPEGERVFCSSVQGYGIRQSHNILDTLKSQFGDFEVFSIIIHSPRYYESSICLNEMGAVWVLGTRYASFMTTDCSFKQLDGVINNNVICIYPKDKLDQLNTHLNNFKDDLLGFFGRKSIDENKWENARNRFIKEVVSFSY